MLRVYGCFVNQHDPRLVLLAVVVCLAATFATVNLLHHARKSRARMRRVWLGVAGAASGFGIWATHFVAMLAFAPGLPGGYDITLTLLSLVAAILLTGAGFRIAIVAGLPGAVWLGGAVVGGGIATMHYTGMAAYEVAGRVAWDPALVATSIVLGAAIGGVGLHAGLRDSSLRSKVLGALLLTIAICTHHFTAMGAVTIVPDPLVTISERAVPESWLAIAVALASLAVLLLAFLGLALDIRVEQASDLAAANRRLEQRTRELDEKAALLQATLDNMDQGILMVDADGTVPVCNQRAMGLLDLPPDLMGSRPAFEAVRQYQLEHNEFAKSDETLRRWVETRGSEAKTARL
jgi:NO-binding membrane sensor protein with MHYT domain